MPDNLKNYTVEGPDGHSYTVSAAPDATDDELVSFVQQNLSQQPSTVTPAPVGTGKIDVGNGVSSTPTTPATPAESPNIQHEYAQGLPTADPEWMDADSKAQVTKMMLPGSGASYDDISNYIKGVAKNKGLVPVGLGGTPEQLEAYRQSVLKGGAAQTPGYTQNTQLQDLADTSKSNLTPKINAPELPQLEAVNQLMRGFEQGAQYMGSGAIARNLAYYLGYGKDTIDKLYPDATPEQKGELLRSFIGEVQNRTRSADATETANDNPITNFIGQASVPDPVDVLPIGLATHGATPAARLFEKGAEGTAVNAGMSAGYQALDVNQGASDKIDPLEVVKQGALGGLLHAGLHAGHELISSKQPTVDSAGTAVPPEPIFAPTARKNSKAYSKQLDNTRQGIADHINSVAKDWTNSPDFEVHPNFNGIDGIEKNAIGAYGPDGRILVNTEALLKESKATGKSPETVASAMVYHEALGHHGLAQKFGDDLDDTLTNFYENGVSTFKNRVDEWMDKHPNSYKDQPDRLQRSIEEVLAEDSEKGQLPLALKDRISNKIKDYGRAMGLSLKYSDREIQTILAMAHDATINGHPNDVRSNGFKMMNVGENANLPIDMQADRIRAQTADALNTKTPDEIYDQFGWWKDQDGKWRTRLSDANSDLYTSKDGIGSALDDLPEDGSPMTLGKVLDHPTLYKAYPWLHDMSIRRETRPGYLGAYDPNKKYITINPETLTKIGEDPHSVLLHEVQHSIQDHEDFAGGGNQESALANTLKAHELIPAAERLLGDKEADLERTHDTVKNISEVLKKAQNLTPELREKLKEQSRQLITDSYSKQGAIDALKEHLEDQNIPAIFDFVTNSQKIKREAYDLLMGEIEARETEKLKNVPQDELRSFPKGVGSIEKWDPDYIRIADRKRSVSRKEISVQDQRRQRQEQLIKSSRGIKTPAERIVDSVERIVKSDSEKTIDRGIGQIHDVLDNHPTSGIVRARAIEALHNLNDLRIQKFNEGGNAKYMQPSPKEKAKEESSILSAKDMIEGALENYEPTIRSWSEGKAAARDRGITAAQIRKTKSIGELDKRIFVMDRAADTLNTKLAKLFEKRDNGTFTVADRERMKEVMYSYNEVLSKIWGEHAELARALNALKAVDYRRRNFGKIKDLLDETLTQHDPLNDPAQFEDFADKLKYLMESQNPKGVQEMVRQVMKPYWWEYLLSFRHSMMLSGLGTHAKNAKDNALMLQREFEETVLAAPGFVVRKGLQKAGLDVKDGVSPQEISGRFYGIMRAFLDADTYTNTAKAFMRGHPNHSLNPKIEMADARIPVVSKVSDALYAADTLFRAFHDNANLYTLGVRRARDEGLTGMNALQEGSNYAVNPSEKMLKEMHQATNAALLIDTPSWLSAKLEVSKSIRPNMKPTEQLGSFATNLLFPFFRVTDRLLFQQLRRSPLSFLDKNTRADFAAGGARRDIAIARTLFGSALIYYYWQQAGKGNVVGQGPADYDKKQALVAGGFKPNSALENGKYKDATALNLSFLPGDLQNTLAANVATIREAYDEGKADHATTAQALGLAALGLGNVLSSNSFANNISQYMEPFQQSNQSSKTTAVANVGASLATQWIPAAMRQYNQAYADTIQRDTTGNKSVTDRIVGRVMAAIPGLSNQLPAKHTVYGDVLDQGRSLSGLNNYQTVKTDDVSKAIQALEKTTPGAVVTGAPTSFKEQDAKKFEGHFDPSMVASVSDTDYIKLTAKANQEWQQTQGSYLKQAMQQVIKLDGWKAASTEAKIAIVKEVRKEAYAQTKDEMLPKLLGKKE